MPPINPSLSATPPADDSEKTKQPKAAKPIAPTATSHFSGVNLMSKEFDAVTPEESGGLSRILVSSLLWSILIVAVAYGGVRGYEQYAMQQLSSVSGSLAQVNASIQQLEGQRAPLVKFQSKLSEVDKVLKGHVYWSRFLDGLERDTLPEVAYSDVTTNEDGSGTGTATILTLSIIGPNLVVPSEPTFGG